MIHPSYTELMEAINEAGKDAMVPSYGKKPLSTAVEEIYKGKVHILPEDAELEEEPATEEDTTETME